MIAFEGLEVGIRARRLSMPQVGDCMFVSEEDESERERSEVELSKRMICPSMMLHSCVRNLVKSGEQTARRGGLSDSHRRPVVICPCNRPAVDA